MTGADSEQLGLSAVDNGGLLSENFLENRLTEWREYRDLDCGELLEAIGALWQREGAGLENATEAQVEEHFLQPILALLGHSWTPQAGFNAATARSIPDYAMFLSDDARRTAAMLEKNSIERFSDAVAVAEAKEFDRPLQGRRAGPRSEDPHAQILRYLKDTRVSWGILTNGRHWRLYSFERATQGEFYGVDLIALVQAGDLAEFRRFAAFFSRAALEPDDRGHSFLDRAFAEAESNAIEVGEQLEQQVFAALPGIAAGLLGEAERTPETLAEAFENSLVLLYRLLFCLHAEARKLLPLDSPQYERESLRRIREEVADQRDRGIAYTPRSDKIYSSLRALFRMIDEGEAAFSVNAYNGGLFSPTVHKYFAGRTVPDPQMAAAVDLFSRVGGRFVDYRDLSVRQLGTIYEKLLAFTLAEGEAGNLVLEPSTLKHRSGAYFTPQRVVDAIVARTLDPLLAAKSRAIRDEGLTGEAALDAFLELKICDPAAGSGHFLVAAAQHVAEYIATDPTYEAGESGERLDLSELTRRVAERCLYGVDINPMAVELARLSLWLATVEGDQPLTFLENLRVGNSIVGASVRELLEGEESVFSSALARDAEELIEKHAEIAGRSSGTTSDVHDKERLDEAARDLRRPLEDYADETLGLALDDPEVGDPFHWEVEFPEVFLTREGELRGDGGFDAVIGNPPYVQIQSLGRSIASFCRRRFASAKGAFDAYLVFIEQGVNLLGPQGRLGYIAPNKVFKLDSGSGLRELLAAEALVEEIADFGDFQVFEGVTNYTCIVVLDRSGNRDLTYRRIGREHAEAALGAAGLDSIGGEAYDTAELGSGAWRLVPHTERAIMTVIEDQASPLGEVAGQIFQGLITSADPVYIVSLRSDQGAHIRAFSKAAQGEVELEPDLLHPLASGTEIEPYGFRPLDDRLLFPYRRSANGAMELIPMDEIEELWPLVAAYLRGNEETLRGREKGAFDDDDWHRFGRTQSLGNHDLPKLGVAATVQHLEIAPDPNGEVYFHNVRVNGILPAPDGASLWHLQLLLSSRLLDWVFRRGAAEHANGFYAANKQFIAPLPIRIPEPSEIDEFETLARDLNKGAMAIRDERAGFLDWLAGRVGVRLRELSGHTKFARYEFIGTDGVLDVLQTNKRKLESKPIGSRRFRDQLAAELDASRTRLADFTRAQSDAERRADALVFELYELTSDQRQMIESEYAS